MLSKLGKLWIKSGRERRAIRKLALGCARPTLGLEVLEVRNLPATIVPYPVNDPHRIDITGTASDETVTIDEVGDQIEVRVKEPGKPDTVATFNRAGITGIEFVGHNGNDTLTNNTKLGDGITTFTIEMHASGGTGVDTFTGGPGRDFFQGWGSNDVLKGMGGQDFLRGGSGEDLLEGGEGSDKLYGEADVDTLDGGGGFDFLDGGNDGDTLIGNSASADFDAYNWVYAGATYDDVIQTGVNDCAFMTSLAGIADTGEDLASRIRYLGNNEYEMSLYDEDDGKWYWEDVTFNGSVSDLDAGTTLSPDGQFRDFWVLLYQRAYLDYLDEHSDLIEFFGPTGFSFTGTAMSALTGQSYNQYYPLLASEAVLLNRIRTALDQGRPVVGVVWAGESIFSGPTTPLLETWHAYTVLGTGVNSSGATTLVLRNPWGHDIASERHNAGEASWHNQDDGLIHITLAEFRDSMHDYYIGNVVDEADVLFDVRELEAGYDGTADTIEVRADPSAGNFLEVLFNGQRVRRREQSRVGSLTIRGSDADDTFRISADGLDVRVILEGGGGKNSLGVIATNRADTVDAQVGGIWVDTGSVTTGVLYSGIETVQIDTLDDIDDIWLYGVADGVTMTVNGGNQIDRFTTSGPAGRALRLNGGDHDDIFSIGNTAVGATYVNGIVINGDGGADNISIDVTAVVPPTIISSIYLMVNGGDGDDRISASALASQIVNLNGNVGADRITVRSAEPGSRVTVDGGQGADTLVGPGSANTWHVTGVDAGDINADIAFSNTENLKGGGVSNRFEIPLGGSISGEIEGGSNDDDLIFDDTANATGGTYEIRATAVTLPGGRQISYELMEYLELNSSTSGLATINLTGSTSAVRINTGNGDDTVNIETTSRTLSALRGAVTVEGGGHDELTIDDTGRTAPVVTAYVVSGSFVDGDHTYPVNYTDALARVVLKGGNTGSLFQVLLIETEFELHGGSGADHLTAWDLRTGSHVSFFGGGGSDTLTLAETRNTWTVTGTNQGQTVTRQTVGAEIYESEVEFQSVENLTGGNNLDTFTFQAGASIGGTANGAGSFNTLTINDATLVGREYVLGVGSLTRNAAALVNYSNMRELILNAGPSADTVTVQGTAAGTTVTLNLGGSGGDVVEIGTAAASLAAVQGALTVTGGGHAALSISDAAAAERHDYTLTATTLQRNGAALITFQGLEELTLSATNFNDLLLIQGLSAATVSLDGLGGGNTLSGPNVAATWQVQGANQGTLTAGGTASFTSMQTLNGGSQDDRFVFANGQGVTGSVYGNGGTDTLDFSAYGAPFGVNLNLATGQTNRGASFVWFIENVMGGFGNDTLTGNYANNIILGGKGNDTLLGGDGRDLLIGGDGIDTLNGGQHDDILIGGYTSHDQNFPALAAIMSEWTSTTTPYAQRVDHLRGTLPGGRNGGWHLRLGTVWQDTQVDTFTGGSGDDWFWGQIPGEPNDRLLGERVN